MTNKTRAMKSDTNGNDGQREIWPDIIRIVAVFAVIVLHTGVEHFYRIDTRTAAWQICNLYESLVRFCVPVFLMVSGRFLMDPAREYTLKKLYGVKILRLATAYLFWSVFYVMADHWFALKYGADVKLSCSVFFPGGRRGEILSVVSPRDGRTVHGHAGPAAHRRKRTRHSLFPRSFPRVRFCRQYA